MEISKREHCCEYYRHQDHCEASPIDALRFIWSNFIATVDKADYPTNHQCRDK
ncbi:MAG: hypothetical protein ACKV0T_04090 [Planctomycetales bacterium]